MTLWHFLLVYDLDRQELVEQTSFKDGQKAGAAYAELERKHQGNPDLEIVLVGADSIETIKATHAHYFDGNVDRAGSRYLAGI
jgi:hypothetical protein